MIKQNHMYNENIRQSNESGVGLRNIATIVLSVLITAFVVGGAVYAWQKSLLNKTEQSLQTEIISLQNQIKELQATIKQKESVPIQKENGKENTLSESVIPDNWKTYNDNELHYSISYPSDWEVKEYNEDEVYIAYPGWRQAPEGGGAVVISVENKTLEQFLEEHKNNPSYDGAIVSQTSYTLNNISGHKLVMTTAIGLEQSIIFISRANKSYIIRFHEYDNDHIEIIETFRFN